MTRGYVPLPERGVLAIGGPDARAFLQGLISNDIERVGPEQAIYAALLTPQGKFLFDFIIMQAGETLLLDVERARAAELHKRLMMYKLRAKVTIEDQSERFAIAALLGDGVAAALDLPAHAGAARTWRDGLALIDPRLTELGGRAVLPAASAAQTLTDAGFEALPADAYEQRRIALGVPDGARDLIVDKATLLENGFEELHGVDFKKGCFVGQELTARMKYRGLVRKRLMPVELRGPCPDSGAIIRLGDKEAGEMRSSINGQGLALLRLEQIAKAAEAGTPLLAGETEVVPLRPSWANF
jgi:hypothetical protein